MRENQLRKIDCIFKAEKMKIRPTVIKLPEQLSLKWKSVGTDDGGVCSDDWRGTLAPTPEFLANIEKYQDNMFLDIGERQS